MDSLLYLGAVLAESWITVRKADRPSEVLVRARWCDSALCRLRGLTFRRRLTPGEGLVLVETVESRLGTSIHMMGVFFSLGVLWINNHNCVVDTRLAKPGGLYFPRSSARYVLEADPSILQQVRTGDVLEFCHED